MTKARLYFDAPALVIAMLEHGGDAALSPIAKLAGRAGFAPESLLGHKPAFDLVRDSVRAWCAANHMKPGFWTHDAAIAREAVLFLGQYLAGLVDLPKPDAATLAQWFLDNREAAPEASRFFERQTERMSVFDYSRPIAQSCGQAKTAMRQIAYAYGEAESIDGVASICPAIRHEAAGLILDSLEKSFSPSIF